MDCGEATQIQMRRYGIKAQQLDAIFISHLHGDHYLGLVGLLSSLHLQGRTRELTLFGPMGLDDLITLQLKHSDTIFKYKLKFVRVDTEVSRVIHEDERTTVTTIPLSHRIPCCGFLIKEKPHRPRLNKDKLPDNLRLQDIALLKQGKDIVDENDNVVLKAREVLLPPKKSRSYAFCSDTKYLADLHKYFPKVDLMYHEATFLNEKELTASNTLHSTASQAAMVARDAKAGRLLLGHFSARYKDVRPFQEEARLTFPESYLAVEGKSFSIEH